LPPSLRCDVPLLRDFLYGLPPLPLAIEFRHLSWYTDEIFDLLAEHRAALAITESDEDDPVMEFIGPLAYLRLHRSAYTPAQMKAWGRHVESQLGTGKDVYAYFTHEDGAPAPTYAENLRAIVDGR
jgi:uncharacterized protein YecE (DUF72 family)